MNGSEHAIYFQHSMKSTRQLILRSKVGNAFVDRRWNFRSTCLRSPLSAETFGLTIPEFVLGNFTRDPDDYVWDMQGIRGNRWCLPPINSVGTSIYQRDINFLG
jgi:hypothetical protein